jgi:LytS/YehU family sensor histidine kinase
MKPVDHGVQHYVDAQRRDAEARAYKRVREMRGFYFNALFYVILIPACWIFNLTSTPHALWAVFPTIGWGIGLTIHGLNAFADRSFFGQAWEEEKVAELMARENLKVVSREKQLVQAQMRMLQAQIEPHFLFNTLANIQSLIARAPDKANLMMDNFIAYLRESLAASRAHEGTVSQEFALLRHYLALIKIRMDARLSFELTLDPALASEPLAPMLLQPIVENAIKHGLEPKLEGGSVSVTAASSGGRMLILVRDNGLGFSDVADHAGTGVGLANLRERLALLYAGDARLTIVDAKPGTEIVLNLPLSGNQS